MTAHRALVTGATGFVGSNLVTRLLDSDWDVHVLVRPGSRDNFGSQNAVRVTRHQYVGTWDSISSVVRSSQPEVVFHLASYFVAEHESADVDALIRSNLLFGTQLVEAMSLSAVPKLINAGTAWQHYNDKEYSPVNLYAATKQAFETLLQYYVEARGLQVITLKLHDTYGPGDTRQKLVALLQSLENTTSPVAMSGGEQEIELLHIDDVTRAFLMAAERLTAGLVTGHERYALASGVRRSLREIVALYEEMLGRKLPIVWGARPYRVREVMRPWRTGLSLPGWQPKIDLASGFAGLLSRNSD